MSRRNQLQFLRNQPARSEEDDRNQTEEIDLVAKAISGLDYDIRDHDKRLSDLCSSLAESTLEHNPTGIDVGVCGNLVKLLSHQKPSVYVPALKTIGNIVFGGDKHQLKVILDDGVLPCLRKFMVDDFEKDVKEVAVWTVSNLLTGTEEQIQCVIEADVIGPIIDLFQHAEFDIQEVSVWAISNACFYGTPEQIEYIVSQGCIKPLCDLLISPESDIILICLQDLEIILCVGDAEKDEGKMNVFSQMIDGAGGWVKIKDLQKHEKADISEKALKILSTYGAGVDGNNGDSNDAAPSSSGSGSGSGGSDPNVASGGLQHSN